MDYETLARQFESASSQWPNLESHIVVWPKTKAWPELDFQQNTFVTGRATFNATGFCEISADWGSDHAATLRLVREMGKHGRRPVTDLTSEDIDADFRYRTLADQCVQLLAGTSLQLQQYTDAWRVILHERARAPWAQLPGYDADYKRQIIGDVFLESAIVLRAMAGVVQSHKPATTSLQVDPTKAACDAWIIKQWDKGKTLEQIRIALTRKPAAWQGPDTISGVRGRIKAAYKRADKEVPKRQKGRKTKR